MDKARKTQIRYELYSYRVNKKLAGSIQEYIEAHKKLVQALRAVQAIDAALAELPDDVNGYVREKYFDGANYTPDGLSMHFHVGNKTISRWDQMLLAAVHRYLVAAKL